MNIHYRIATLDDIEKMSKQLTASYVSAYKDLMSKEYLSSLPANHWVPILEVSMHNGDNFYLSHGFVKTSTFTVEENGMILSCDKMTKTFKEPCRA